MNKQEKINIIWIIFIGFFMIITACQGEKQSRGNNSDMEAKQMTSQLRVDPEQLHNDDQDGRTLLHRVVIKGDLPMVRLAIEEGADLEKQDKYGYRPLHYAAKHGHIEIARLLISRGVDLNAKTHLGYTPLHWAARMEYPDMVELLIAHGADMQATDIDGATPKDFALNGDSRETQKQFYPFHLAVETGDIDQVKILLDKEPGQVNSKNNNGRTPLHLAMWYDRDQIAALLLARGADPQVKDKWGFIPLYYSAAEREKRTGINLLEPSRLRQVDDCVFDILNNYNHINVGLVYDGEIVLTRSYGKNMLNNEDVYASVSKTVTAVMVLQLLKEGKIKSLDDDIRDYSAMYKNSLPLRYKKTPITFMHLLTHRSGVPHLSGLWKGKKLNLAFEPGTRFRYSTSGYGILGQILQEITGQSFDSLVKLYIGKPVGGTSFWAENVFRAPGARVHSTIHDMALYALGVINAIYVPADMLDNLMFKQYSGVIGLAWSCIHVDTSDLTLFHAGSNGKPRAFLMIKPRKKLAAALLGENKSAKGALEFESLSNQLIKILENIHQQEPGTK